MESWSFLTNHARVLLCIARDPGLRLRDIAAGAGITERSAFGIVTDLAEAGYIAKHKNGRRNSYHIQEHLPLPEPVSSERTIGEVLALLTRQDRPRSKAVRIDPARPRRLPARIRRDHAASPDAAGSRLR